MQRKYIISLIIIGLLLLSSLMLFSSYYLWSIDDVNNAIAINTDTCVKIIYSDEETFNLTNPKALSDSDGVISTPRTVTITNNCSSTQNVELHLDVLNSSTIDDNKIKVYVNGEFDLNPTILTNLRYIEGSNETKKTYRLFKSSIDAGDTKRINLRMWLDENATITPDKNTFNSKYYIASSELVIKPSLAEILLSSKDTILNKETPDFSKVSLTDDGLYSLNNAYYYRGNVTNNYVSFANSLWRIVGINSDSTIKLISESTESTSNYYDDATKEESVGYTNNGEMNSDSNIKTNLNNWYNTKLKDYDSYIANYNFCNDTTSTNEYRTNYGAYNRVFNEFNPTNICPTTDKNYGGVYNAKVGLITLDEVSLAGGTSKQNNNSYYLYDGNDFYTMSPAFYGSQSWVGIVNKNGKIDATASNNTLEIRPVINLINSVTVTGDGTVSNPYVIDEE